MKNAAASPTHHSETEHKVVTITTAILEASPRRRLPAQSVEAVRREVAMVPKLAIGEEWERLADPGAKEARL
jgi:hypothetical protein